MFHNADSLTISEGVRSKEVLHHPAREGSKALTDQERLWHMRWFLAIILMVWILATLILVGTLFCITHNALCLSLCTVATPPAVLLSKMAAYLFPHNEWDYKLAALKIMAPLPSYSMKEATRMKATRSQRGSSEHSS